MIGCCPLNHLYPADVVWLDTEPAEPAAVGFAGAGVQRDAIPLCLGTGAAAPCAECRGGEPLLRCPEVENLGPGKLDACVKLYWVLPAADTGRVCGFAALPASKFSDERRDSA